MDQPLKPLEAIVAGRNLIEASAGTGKTWNITALYARLLLEKKLSIGNILVVTYTTAATAELRERIRTRLAQLLAVYDGAPTDDAMLVALYQQFPQAEHHRRLRLAVHGFDEAAIFTIHGFCQRALQDAAFDAGGDFDNELTQDDSELIDEILTDLWRQELSGAGGPWASFLEKKKLNPKLLRQRLRSHLGKPYLKILPEPVSESFTSSVPKALLEAWQSAKEQWLSHSAQTCEALCACEVLNKNSYSAAKIRAWQQALDAYFTDFACVYEAGDALARLASGELRAKTKKNAKAPVSALSDQLQLLVDALEAAQPENEQRLVSLQVRLLTQLNRLLPERKAEQRILAFDDLLNRLEQGLYQEGGDTLAMNLRSQYPVALIDEFQDTDPIQYRIFRRIYQDGGDLCFVGDPKQAIYAFRGADLATYLTARRESQRTYSLDTNHRSTPELISALNSLFAHPCPFAEAGLRYPKVKAAPPRHAPLVLPEETKALNWVWMNPPTEGKEKGLTKAQADQLAAQDCAARIAKLLHQADQGQVYFAEQPPVPLRGGDIAVLVASHREASLMAQTLAKHGVPSVRRGKDNVWASDEADEFEAVLRAYAEPSREPILRHALLTRLLGRSAAELLAYQTDPGSWDRERESAERYHALWQQGFMRAFTLWLDEQQVAERLLALADGERRLTNLLHLAELVQEQSMQRPGLEALLAWYSAQRGSEVHGDSALLRLESDAERVQIVTIHTSKGLEYPLVFCPFLWNGRLLQSRPDSVTCHNEAGELLVDLGSEDFDQHLAQARAETFAEKLRLVYVALTRARAGLWVHWGPVQQGAEFTGDEGLHTSALAWLLQTREQAAEVATPAQALELLGEQLLGEPNAKVLSALEQLVAANPQSMTLVACESAAALDKRNEARAPEPCALQRLNRTLKSAWRMGSFSALTYNSHSEAPDRDQQAPLLVQEPGEGFFAFPRGARAGVCLHAIFENWANGQTLDVDAVAQSLTEHGIDAPLWAELTHAHLMQVLETALDGQGLRLSALTRKLPELSFTFPVAKLDVARLQKLLQDPQYGLPESMRSAASRLSFESLNGFMRGFIDLTFEHQGRWYIADYKSNWLGATVDDYRHAALEQIIAREHYYVQYLIYLTALRRHLKHRLGEAFTEAHIGGAFYLFIRAMPEAGVYVANPSTALLQALDQLFSEAGQ